MIFKKMAIQEKQKLIKLYKTCTKCNKRLDVENFRKSIKKDKEIRQAQCKSCERGYQHIKKLKNYEEEKRKNYERVKVYRAKKKLINENNNINISITKQKVKMAKLKNKQITKSKPIEKRIYNKRIVEPIIMKKYREIEELEEVPNTLMIEDFLPQLRSPRQEKLREEIVQLLYKIDVGQSFFISKARLHVGTIRKIVLPELQKKEFKNCDIRIVVNKKTEIPGCRIARYV